MSRNEIEHATMIVSKVIDTELHDAKGELDERWEVMVMREALYRPRRSAEERRRGRTTGITKGDLGCEMRECDLDDDWRY